ncbi:hypothetical protein ACXWRS_10265, partial [Streptococcus pyogenes]
IDYLRKLRTARFLPLAPPFAPSVRSFSFSSPSLSPPSSFPFPSSSPPLLFSSLPPFPPPPSLTSLPFSFHPSFSSFPFPFFFLSPSFFS